MSARDAEDCKVVDDDWARFRNIDMMKNHWDRPGWEFGRRAYYWYLTFEEVDELQQLTSRCQERLHISYLDHVPPPDIHMTIERVGFEDEVSPDVLAEIKDNVTLECSQIRPFDLSIGPLGGSSGALRFSVTPWRPLFHLKESIRSATLARLPSAEPDPGDFLPHIGIAYCNRQVPSGDLIEAVRGIRHFPIVRSRVRRVTLVRLERSPGAWLWEPLAAATLGD